VQLIKYTCAVWLVFAYLGPCFSRLVLVGHGLCNKLNGIKSLTHTHTKVHKFLFGFFVLVEDFPPSYLTQRLSFPFFH
jgi:hypothetical protein